MAEPQTAKKSPEQMTIAELHAEIGRLQMILHWKVLGNPRRGAQGMSPFLDGARSDSKVGPAIKRWPVFAEELE